MVWGGWRLPVVTILEGPPMGIRAIGERLEATEGLDRLAHPACRAATRLLPRGPVKDFLHGVWLGPPLHPVLTDLPIGFWTSAFVLDLVGGRRARPAADALVGVGVAAALPTTAAGLADWSELNEPERRAGLMHAVANFSATALYGLSFLGRRSGRRTRGVILGLAGAAAATAGGFLGGHLTYRRAAGVNHAADAPTNTEWAEVAVDGTLNRHNPTLAPSERIAAGRGGRRYRPGRPVRPLQPPQRPARRRRPRRRLPPLPVARQHVPHERRDRRARPRHRPPTRLRTARRRPACPGPPPP